MFNIVIVGHGEQMEDPMVDALPTLRERVKKTDPNILLSVTTDLSKVC